MRQSGRSSRRCGWSQLAQEDYPGLMPESKGRRKSKQIKRPTPPKSAVKKAEHGKPPSPTWYVSLMFGLMGIGVVLVVVRYLFQLDNTVLLLGLTAIAVGFVMTTNYH